VRRNCASRNRLSFCHSHCPATSVPLLTDICSTLWCRPPHRMCPDAVRKGYGMLQAYLAKQVEVRYSVFPPNPASSFPVSVLCAFVGATLFTPF
jgi:hypothetical protein